VSHANAYRTELDFALDCVRQAGEQIRAIASSYDVAHKGDGSLVTTADLQINEWFVEQAAEQFPRDRVLGEELSSYAGGPRTWVIDPLDGTSQFVLGIPVWMIAIALTDEDGRPVLAVAHNPSLRIGSGSMYWAIEGGGAFRDGEPIRVSTRDGAAIPAWLRGEGAERVSDTLSGTLLEVAFAPTVRATERRVLPAVFACCLVAEGSLDGVLYTGSGAHDLAAGSLMVREAGGLVTDLAGAEQRYDAPVNGGVLSNGLIHDALLRQRITGDG
jgi:fructose-1,6-bisphosphatase/inositol monophosphatase family enzyme